MSDHARSRERTASGRLVFIGSEALLSRIPLEALIREHEVVGIIACRSRQRLRSQRSPLRRLLARAKSSLAEPTLESLARAHGIDFREMSSGPAEQTARWIAERRPDLGCVSAVSRLLPASIYRRPRLGFVNLHPALLPNYRGPFPLLWQYLTFDRRGGVSVHAVDAGADTGAVFAQREVEIGLAEPIDELTRRLAAIGAEVLVETVGRIVAGDLTPVPQSPEAPSCLARRLEAGETPVDWEKWPIEHLYHVLGGLNGWTLPPPRRAWLHRWDVIGFERNPSEVPVRTIGRDDRGHFAAHGEGRIRLKRFFRFPLPKI